MLTSGDLPPVAFLNGPHLNLLRLGEPDLDGRASLDGGLRIGAETAIELRFATVRSAGCCRGSVAPAAEGMAEILRERAG